MSGYKYFILHLTKTGQERLGFSEDSISVWDYSNDEEATKLDGRLWYKARLAYQNKTVYVQIRHDEIQAVETVYISSDSNSNSCFIATACSANIDELGTLYHFRDKYLINFGLGEKFVKLYYTFSPEIADIIRDSTILKRITRWLFIKPIVFVLGLFFSSKRNHL